MVFFGCFSRRETTESEVPKKGDSAPKSASSGCPFFTHAQGFAHVNWHRLKDLLKGAVDLAK
jgi:hypothetical protein